MTEFPRDDGLAEAIVETVREPLLLLDESLRVRTANRAFYRAFHTSPDRTLGRFIYDLGEGQWDVPRLRTLLEEIVPRNTYFDDFEIEQRFPELGQRVMLLNARRLRREGSREDMVLLAIEDVTQRRRDEALLKRRTEELARSNRDLEDFAYVASHDLQEPLRMVVSYTQLLAQRYRGRLDSDADDFIAFAVDGAKRMQRLINDLLVYSRLDRVDAVVHAADARESLEEAVAMLAGVIEESGARVETDGTLPMVRVEHGQLVQLFQNLIGNALKFRSERPPRVKISAVLGAGEATFRVEDNGIGIDPQYFDKVFIIFERLHGAEVPGTGIGLALCRKIVLRHGGRIWIESEPGQGAAFCFTLPLPGETAQ